MSPETKKAARYGAAAIDGRPGLAESLFHRGETRLKDQGDNPIRPVGSMNAHLREPLLEPTPIIELRPTQMTVGMREVTAKRQSWGERDPKKLQAFFASHMAPVIVGPGGLRYLIDHHHLALALHQAGVKSLYVTVVADLSKVDKDNFWNMMDYHGWTHPFDEKGRRRDYVDLPRTIEGLKDDPYRALAGELRKLGGFAKDSTPYSEFVWADFLRRRIEAKAVKADFDAALSHAMELAKSGDSDYLPGWSGPHAAPVQAPSGKKPGKAGKKKG